jgi:hypothetical protein
LVNDEA